MPRGRPRLDPEVKLEHLKQSRKNYEDKNVDLRRRKARELLARVSPMTPSLIPSPSRRPPSTPTIIVTGNLRPNEQHINAPPASRKKPGNRRNKISIRSIYLPALSVNGVCPDLAVLLLRRDIPPTSAQSLRSQHPIRKMKATTIHSPHSTTLLAGLNPLCVPFDAATVLQTNASAVHVSARHQMSG
ncbi:hypothetical protein FB45DRAFT_1033341 [Roridomyces roridus]|uniref:Uncharacterized protein n=1 Tax=Roridomyces roridus TaxID=1738132 RepID=A0AAD7BF58_9AGAR|nr:hypothetical protein FB45DRAFT_1033341 [Roridomyces roridus]